MSPNRGSTGIPSDGFGGALRDTPQQGRTYRTIHGFAQLTARNAVSPADPGDFEDSHHRDESHDGDSPRPPDQTFLDDAFRAAEEAYGEHGGGTSASWLGFPAVAWSQPVGDLSDGRDDTHADAMPSGNDRGRDTPFAIPRGFPHTRKIGAFSALTSRRLYGQTPTPVVVRPMAFRPDEPTLALDRSSPASAKASREDGLVEYSTSSNAPQQVSSALESTRIFILTGVERHADEAETPSPVEPIPLPIAPTLSVSTVPPEMAEGGTLPIAAMGQTPPPHPDAGHDSTARNEGETITGPAVESPSHPEQRAFDTSSSDNLSSSVLTSADSFIGQRAALPASPPKRAWGSRFLIFALSMALTVAGGITLIGLERSRLPWLRDQMNRFWSVRPTEGQSEGPIRPSPTPSVAPPASATLSPTENPALRGHAEEPSAPFAARTPVASPRPQEDLGLAASAPSPDVARPPPVKADGTRDPVQAKPPEVPGPAVAVPSLVGAVPPDPAPDHEPTSASHSAVSRETPRLAVASPRHRSIPETASPEPNVRRTVVNRSAQPLRSRAMRLDTLRGQGEDLLAAGKIAEARAIFKRMAAAGDPRGARGMARTYDEEAIARFGGAGELADREKSKFWSTVANSLESRRVGKLPPTTMLPEDLR